MYKIPYNTLLILHLSTIKDNKENYNNINSNMNNNEKNKKRKKIDISTDKNGVPKPFIF